MKVAFMIGNNSQKVVTTLNKQADDIEFFVYKNIGLMIKESTLRHLFFGRIVFSEAILSKPEKELEELNDFIKNNSDSTEIVMIANNKKNTNGDKIFTGIFNSPMYTPVILESVTPKSLMDLVTLDMLELKTKYYVLDKKSEEKVVVEQKSDKEEEKNIPRKEKRGFFGSKKSKVEQKQPEDEPKGEEVKEEQPEFNGFGVEASGGEQVEFSNPSELAEGVDIDDSLSLGDLGSQHSDTGYLDEEGDKELEEFLKRQQEENVKKEEHPVNDSSSVVSNIVEKPNKEVVKPVSRNTSSKKINILVGEKGSCVTQIIVDKAVSLASKGYKVVIVDMDAKENGVLSFIDSVSYYRNGCSGGLQKFNPYIEDGVDVLSNGYGSNISEDLIYNVLKRCLDRYDFILVDCPVESLKYMSIRILEISISSIVLLGNKGNIVSTSLALTDRSNVSLNVENYIMTKCAVNVIRKVDTFREELESARRELYFPNGCWLDSIE